MQLECDRDDPLYIYSEKRLGLNHQENLIHPLLNEKPSLNATFLTGYRPRFVHTRPTRSLSVEFEGQIYDIDLQADDQSAVRRRFISKRHYSLEDPEFDLGSDDGSEEMLADDTNAIGYPNSVKVTHK